MNKNYCDDTSPLVLIYSKLLPSNKANKIYLAGFDGYKKDDPSNDETKFLLNNIFHGLFSKVSIKTVTRSNYKIPKKII